jgi:hypothetical protein
MSKKSRKKAAGDDQGVQGHLDGIKKDLEELRAKLGMTKQGDFSKLPIDAAKRLSDTASEIMKTASDVVEKTLKVAQYAAIGAIEGGKKALKEELKQKKKKKSQ